MPTLTVRPLDEKGEQQYKTEKEYLCAKDGEERGFPSSRRRRPKMRLYRRNTWTARDNKQAAEPLWSRRL